MLLFLYGGGVVAWGYVRIFGVGGGAKRIMKLVRTQSLNN